MPAKWWCACVCVACSCALEQSLLPISLSLLLLRFFPCAFHFVVACDFFLLLYLCPFFVVTLALCVCVCVTRLVYSETRSKCLRLSLCMPYINPVFSWQMQRCRCCCRRHRHLSHRFASIISRFDVVFFFLPAHTSFCTLRMWYLTDVFSYISHSSLCNCNGFLLFSSAHTQTHAQHIFTRCSRSRKPTSCWCVVVVAGFFGNNYFSSRWMVNH